MPKNKITDLRNHLFEMIENLKDCDATELDNTVNRAKAISRLSDSIIESAKLEVAYLDKINKDSIHQQSDFLQIGARE